jgi:hypothetical protein
MKVLEIFSVAFFINHDFREQNGIFIDETFRKLFIHRIKATGSTPGGLFYAENAILFSKYSCYTEKVLMP